MYVAKNLEDIALLFDQNAISERANATNPKKKAQERVAHHAAARTWEQAAGILRNTTIMPTTIPKE
jgi:hypothetical protein